MKNKAFLIVTGIISILSSLTMNGLPVGTNILEIIYEAAALLGLAAVFYAGFIKQNDKMLMILSIAYTVVLFGATMLIEMFLKDFVLVGIGFLPGLVMSLAGLVRNHRTNRSIAVYIICGIALMFAVASIALMVMQKSFIMTV